MATIIIAAANKGMVNNNNVEVFKIMQIKQSTFLRLANHSKYYTEEDGESYDEIIIKVLDYYEKNYKDDDTDDETEDDLIAELNK